MKELNLLGGRSGSQTNSHWIMLAVFMTIVVFLHVVLVTAQHKQHALHVKNINAENSSIAETESLQKTREARDQLQKIFKLLQYLTQNHLTLSQINYTHKKLFLQGTIDTAAHLVALISSSYLHGKIASVTVSADSRDNLLRFSLQLFT